MPYHYTYPAEPLRLPRALDADHRRWVLWTVTVAVAATLAAATAGSGGPRPANRAGSVALAGR